MYLAGADGGSQAVIDARVLACSLARAATPAEGLAAYEMAAADSDAELAMPAPATSDGWWRRSG